MARRQPIAGSQNACPSCRTRLRVSLQADSKPEFACPECGATLFARSTGNGDLAITAGGSASTVHASRQSDSLVPFSWTSNARTTAVVVVVSFGMFLAILLTPPLGDSSPRPGRDAELPANITETTTDQDISKSDHSVRDTAGSVRDATDERLAVSDQGTPSLPRPHSGSNAENEPAAPTIAARPDSELAGTILNEPPVGLSLPTLGDGQPTGTAGSVQLIAGNQEAGLSDPQAPPQDDEETSNAGDPEVANRNPTDVPPPKVMNVRDRLGFSIRSFQQLKPVPLRELIQTVEQMCRVRVDVSAISDEELDTAVILSLRETTPSAILIEAGRKSGLRVIVVDNSVRMVSAGSE